MSGSDDQSVTRPSREREQARKRLEARQSFHANAISYVVVNLFLVAIWALTGMGYFWPAWVIVGWGIGLFFHAWDVYWKRTITESDVDEELRRRAS
jgi:hypothetical protein